MCIVQDVQYVCGQGEVSSLRLSALSVERACGVVRAALGGAAGAVGGASGAAGGAGAAAAAALQRHHVCGLVLAACRLDELKPVHYKLNTVSRACSITG